MAKPKNNGVTKKKIESIVLVTEKNKKFCIVLGRKLYVYQKGTTQYNLLGSFVYRPRLKKGWYTENEHKTFIPQDEDRESYFDMFTEVINHFIKEQKLYINQEDALVKFEQKK